VNCAEARDALLTADLPELGADGTGDLAAHLRGCAPCATLARRIVAAERGLDATLHRLTPDGAAAAARAALAARRVPPRRVGRVWAGALAAAATVAAVLLLGNGEPTPPSAEARPTSLSHESRESVVSAPPGMSVAVFATDNPRITVYWFF
jgi:anti-sigma factor RsiW